MNEFGYLMLRWMHFLFGITWIGLLYYFNFVQAPFFAETDPAVRSGAVQKLVPRALWWFRWGAMGTVIFGLLYMFAKWGMELHFTMQPWTVAILTGGSMGLIMWGNVWFVIWPNQQVVIANAAAMAGGAQADPAAATAGRRAALASRTNTLFSIPMLFFMGAASHWPSMFNYDLSTNGELWVWAILSGIVIGGLEANALIGTQGRTKEPLDSIPGVIHAGLILWIALVAIIKLSLG
ncbi:MAG TPA: urate hydroxylase PuuD [Candidatus Binataceae bacterium]|nr:urate hydroxylase PuuD [Candidatus Binataceae bacterium]